MSVNQTNLNSVADAYATYETTNEALTKSKKNDYGKIIGEPKLSEAASKYYEKLKKKYGNMDFVLVSADIKNQAQANAASYANPTKTVVLIDEDKIEKMATDESYRKKYEGIISGATASLASMKQSIESSGANVKGYGMQVNDGGNTSFFAVLKKSSADQKARIEKKAEEKRANKEAEEKKSNAKEAYERAKGTGKSDEVMDEEDTITISASSIEELMQKINDYTMSERSDFVMTESEMQLGNHIDFRG